MSNITLPDYMLTNGSLLFPYAPNKTYEHYEDFFAAFCISPPDDSCPPPYICRNPDAAGILVRAAAYGTNFLLGTLILYNPEEALGSFWNFMLFVYSIIISSGISIHERSLTKFHVTVASNLIGSPLLSMLLVYIIVGWFSKREHRLNHILGGRLTEHILPKLAVLCGCGLWLTLMIFTVKSSHNDYFTQSACFVPDNLSKVAFSLTALPYALAIISILVAIGRSDVSSIVNLIPLAMVTVVCVTALFFRRKTIKRLSGGKFKFWAAWSYFSYQYPFLHFLFIFGLSFFYWFIWIEVSIIWALTWEGGVHDNHFELSFGQILAIFTVVEPLLQNIKLLPRLWRWFIDLAWVRLISFRPQKKSSGDNMEVEWDSDTMSLRPTSTRKQSGSSIYTAQSKNGSGFYYDSLKDADYDEPVATGPYKPLVLTP